MSDVPMPNAPASISLRTSSRIWSSCSGVGCLSSKPITYSRMVVAPINDATLHDTLLEVLQVLRERIPFDVVFDVDLLTNHVLAHAIIHRTHRFALPHDLSGYAL